MSEDSAFKLSQDYELVLPQKKRAYPILVEEWEHLKTRISNISDEANIYYTIGSVLLGIAGSAFITALTFNEPVGKNGHMPFAILVAWSVCVGCTFCGCLTFYFGTRQKAIQHATASDVIQQMSLIERRYEVEKISPPVNDRP